MGDLRLTDRGGLWACEPQALRAVLTPNGNGDVMRALGMERPQNVSYLQRVKVNGKLLGVITVAGLLTKAETDCGPSTLNLRRDIRTAAADASVSGILFVIDSPGGTVSGTADLAAEVQHTRTRKPVWSFVEDLGASAAYWVACQAGKVFANTRTALVGSVGSILSIYDLSKAAEKQGVKTHVFGTGPLKGAGTPGSVITEAQQEHFRGLVDDAQSAFDAAVRRGRPGVTPAAFKEVKKGGVFGATEAHKLGLIDGIHSLDDVLAGLSRQVK